MSSRRQATATSAQVTPQMISSTPPVCPPIGPVGIGERVTQRSERLTGPADPRYDLRTDSLFGFKIPACQFSIPSSGEVRFKVAAAIQPDEFYVHLADGIITSSSSSTAGLV